MATWTKISETVVSGTSTQSIILSSIPTTYKDLCIIALLKDNDTASGGQSGLEWEFHNSIAGQMNGAPGYIAMLWGNSSPYNYLYSSRLNIPTYMPNNASGYTGIGPQWCMIYDYASTTVAKNVWLFNGITGNDAYNNNNSFQAWRGPWNNSGNNAIDYIVIKSQSVQFLPNVTVSLYGING